MLMEQPALDKKSDVRRWARNFRKTFTDAVRKQKDEKIAKSLADHPLIDRLQSVMVYYPIHHEVDVGAWVEECWARGVTVTYPRTISQDKRLEPRIVHHPRDLVPGTWGILEPSPSAPLLPPDELDGVIIPGLVFDRFGFRVGYGGGYYDRFLPRLRPDALTIGVVYKELLVDRLVPSQFDVPVDWVATDDGLIHAESLRKGKVSMK